MSSNSQTEQELEALLAERGTELQLVHEELSKRDRIIEKQKIEIDSLSSNIVSKARTEVSTRYLQV